MRRTITSICLLLACQPAAAPSVGAERAADATAVRERPTASKSVARSYDFDVPDVRDPDLSVATAALRAMFQGHRITVDTALIEKECQLDADGASIDDLEDVANKYGLEAEQVVVPAEHVVLPEVGLLPAIAVVKPPDRALQFFAVWRVDGDQVQILDPRDGRRWISRAELLQLLHRHEMPIAPITPEGAAFELPSDGLRARMLALGLERDDVAERLAGAVRTPQRRAALDAALRQVEQKSATDPARALADAFSCAVEPGCAHGASGIPDELWTLRPTENAADGGAQIMLRGAVVVRVAGRRPAAPDGPKR